MTDLKTFLEKKELFYTKIDFSIIALAWESLQAHINLPYVIHLVGTNGKGSTGRFLAHYLNKSKKSVLHYSSPHILSFNERIWINGSDVSSCVLEKTHKELLEILDEKTLSELTYFEYTTLLALKLSSSFDYLVLEAGLGGEFDATNIVKNDLSIITVIDYDHESFLGNTIKAIALTKMRAADTCMILAKQVHEEVKTYASKLCNEKEISCEFFTKLDSKVKNLDFPLYLKENLSLCLMVLKKLNFDINMDLFNDVKLNARCERIRKNITIDVGHNVLAAKVILEEFLSRKEKIILIYNSFKDKNYEEVLNVLKPIIKKVLIINIEDERVIKKNELIKTCKKLEIKDETFINITNKENYLVFGSFLVVEKFLTYLKNESL